MSRAKQIKSIQGHAKAISVELLALEAPDWLLDSVYVLRDTIKDVLESK